MNEPGGGSSGTCRGNFLIWWLGALRWVPSGHLDAALVLLRWVFPLSDPRLLPGASEATALPQVPRQGDSAVARSPPPPLPGILPGPITSPGGHSWLLAQGFRGLSQRWEEMQQPQHEQDLTPSWGLCTGGWAAPRLPQGNGSALERAVSAGAHVGETCLPD